MRRFVIVFSILVLMLAPFSSLARGAKTVYDDMLEMGFMQQQFTHEVTSYGMNFYSVDKINLSDTVSASKIALYLEGPFVIPDNTTLNQVMDFNIDTILTTSVLNKDYPPGDKVAEGIGASIMNIGGSNVGFLDYQLPELSLTNPTNAMAIFRRAVIVKDNKMYGFTIAINDSTIDKGRIMVLDMLVIRALKSGKL